MSNVLDEICAKKREHIAQQQQLVSSSMLEALAKDAYRPRGFVDALRGADGVALIAEVKKASPSKGVIREDFDPVAIATAYEEAGASCISVLTDAPYFQGEDGHLTAVREAVRLPVLRKDFMLDPYQIIESRAIGADCVLLIMAALSDAQAAELEDAAIALGMDVLVEVHDEGELARALKLKSKLLGINNRNLKTLEVSLENGVRLAQQVPDGYLLVCESGIATHVDVVQMQAHGFGAFLVGESLMRQGDIGSATRALIKG